MLALKINDVKNFMNQLLIGDTFDLFFSGRSIHYYFQ